MRCPLQNMSCPLPPTPSKTHTFFLRAGGVPPLYPVPRVRECVCVCVCVCMSTCVRSHTVPYTTVGQRISAHTLSLSLPLGRPLSCLFSSSLPHHALSPPPPSSPHESPSRMLKKQRNLRPLHTYRERERERERETHKHTHAHTSLSSVRCRRWCQRIQNILSH